MAWLRHGVPWGTTSEARELDQRASLELGLPGLLLMETAGGQAADIIHAEWLGACEAQAPATLPLPRVAILCGGGNNGGDGFVVARRLLDRAQVECLVASDPGDAPPDAAVMRRAASACGVAVHDVRAQGTLERDAGIAWLQQADIVIDAVLGTGARLPVGRGALVLLEALAACVRLSAGIGPRARTQYVVALDLPSGGCGDTGQVDLLTPSCGLTVTFGMAKVGLGKAPLAGKTGRVEVVDLGLPRAFRTPSAVERDGKELP